MTVLKKVLSRIQNFKDPGSEIVCIFDLDSTLFDLTDRKQQILLSYLALPQKSKRFREELEALKKVEVYKNEFGIDEALDRIGISKLTHPEFYQDLYSYWENYFFHNNFLKFDVTLPGAVEYVKQVAALGAHIIYLSGRDEPRMQKGTLESLEQSGFPMVGEICLKPHKDIHDHDFKLSFMQNIDQKFKEVWIFENEPVNINLIETHYPDTKFVFIDTNHCGRESLRGAHPSIKDFKC